MSEKARTRRQHTLGGSIGHDHAILSVKPQRLHDPPILATPNCSLTRGIPRVACFGASLATPALTPPERQSRMRLLALNDAADVVQAAPEEVRESLLDSLDVVGKREVTALLAYSEDAAGGLMDPRFVRLRPGLSVDEAISYLRRQAQDGSRHSNAGTSWMWNKDSLVWSLWCGCSPHRQISQFRR